MERIRTLLADAARYYAQLTKREKTLLLLMAGVGAFLTLFISVSVVSSSIEHHQQAISEKESDLKLVAAFAQGYAENERARRELETRLGGAPLRLLTHLQDAAKKHDLTISSMNDRGETTTDQVKESLVELQIAATPIEKLAPLLTDIERDSHIIKVKKLRIRRGGAEDKSLNVTLTVATYSLATKG